MDVRHHSYKWEPHGALFQNGVQVSILLNWETQDTTPHEPLLGLGCNLVSSRFWYPDVCTESLRQVRGECRLGERSESS